MKTCLRGHVVSGENVILKFSKKQDKMYETCRACHKIHKQNYRGVGDSISPRNRMPMGRKYELIALEMLIGSIDKNVSKSPIPWDIEWNGKKIDVKARNLTNLRESKGKCWNFTISKNCRADMLMCFCIRDNEVAKVFLVPMSEIRTCFYVNEKDINNPKFTKWEFKD